MGVLGPDEYVRGKAVRRMPIRLRPCPQGGPRLEERGRFDAVRPERLAQRITGLHGQMVADGDILPRQQLDEFYENFRDRFGLDAMAQLDGEALLTTMHEHGNSDSLVYWLEFKDDEEFSAAELGSITSPAENGKVDRHSVPEPLAKGGHPP